MSLSGGDGGLGKTTLSPLSAPCHERTMEVSLISNVIVERERGVSFWLDSDISSENQLLRCHVTQFSIH